MVISCKLLNELLPFLIDFFDFKMSDIACELYECGQVKMEHDREGKPQHDELTPHSSPIKLVDATDKLLSSNEKLTIHTSQKFKAKANEIKQLCVESWDNGDVHFKRNAFILIFMAALYDRNKYDDIAYNPIEEMAFDYENYTQNIREDMLRLYKARHNDCKNYHTSCFIRFGNTKDEIEIQQKFPWFEKMIDDYLYQKLGVENQEEAETELLKNYPHNVGPKLNKVKAVYTWGTYNLLQTLEGYASQGVTNKQCRFIHEYLSIIGLADRTEILSKAASQIRGNLNFYLKKFTSVADIDETIEYKVSPNHPETERYY